MCRSYQVRKGEREGRVDESDVILDSQFKEFS